MREAVSRPVRLRECPLGELPLYKLIFCYIIAPRENMFTMWPMGPNGIFTDVYD